MKPPSWRNRSFAGRGFAATSRSTSSLPSTHRCRSPRLRSAIRSPTCWPRAASTTTPLFTFNELRPETREVVASDGSAHRIDLLIGVPPHHAPEVVRSSALLGVSGFVQADPRTLQTDHDGVYAIGDVATVRLPNDKALPKAGVFAHAEAKVVARQIANKLNGKTSHAAFDGKGYCWVELGDGRAGFAGGDFYADPEPQLKLRRPGRPLHWGKVAFEKWWLRRWL